MGKDWHEDDEFWRVTAPLLFTPQRIEAADAEVAFALSLLGLEPGAKVLDLCCGVGRHALELARRGFEVTAVDRTAHYLERARDAAAREQLEIELVEEDMRTFRRPAAFDGAINLFSSFGYFEDASDDERVARNLAASLKPGGRLVIDTMSKEVIARDFEERSWREEEGAILLEERAITQAFSWVVNRWIVIPKGGRPVELDLSHRLYSAVELGELLERNGFARTRALGSLDGRPYDHEALRLVMVAIKGEAADEMSGDVM